MSKDSRQVTLAEAWRIIERVLGAADGAGVVGDLVFAGSYRRGLELVNDLDLVVEQADVSALHRLLEKVCDDVFRRKDGLILGGHVDGVRIELYEAKAGCFGATLLHTTGSAEFNIECRKIAKQKGWILSQFGLRDRTTGHRLDDDTEAGILNLLGMDWVPPEKR